MFSTKELDSKTVDEAVLISLNSSFNYLMDNPLKNINELVDQKLLLYLCQEMDTSYYDHFNKSFIFEKNVGIIFAEMKELISKMIEILKKTGISFKYSFKKDFESLNFNSLLKSDKVEVKKLVNLIILSLFNCSNKDIFIDKITNFEEFHQQELIKIVERYMLIDEPTRESINNISSKNISNRNSISNAIQTNLNLIESEFTAKYISKIDYLEKDKNALEKENYNLENKIAEIQIELKTLTNENIKYNNELRKVEENITKLNTENMEMKKTIYTLQNTNKELEDLAKDAKLMYSYKNKLDEKEIEVSYLQYEIKEMNQNHAVEVKKLEEKIEIQQDYISSLSEIKQKYEKMKNMIKDYELMKDKSNLYDTLSKDYSKLKMNYNNLKEEKDNLEILVSDLEKKLDENIKNYNLLNYKEKNSSDEDEYKNEKHDINNTNKSNKSSKSLDKSDHKNSYITINKTETIMSNQNNQIIKEKDDLIMVLEAKISNLEKDLEMKVVSLNNKNDLLNNQRKSTKIDTNISYYSKTISEKDNRILLLESKILNLEKELDEVSKNDNFDDFVNIVKMKDETIKVQDESLNLYIEKIHKLETDSNQALQNYESDITKKTEELEYYRKNNIELKEKYEKEFELMASSIYNLGLTYWSMKMEYTQKLSEKPNWLVKERQKYFNGDF